MMVGGLDSHNLEWAKNAGGEWLQIMASSG